MLSQDNVVVDFGKGISEDIYARYGESGRTIEFEYVNSNIGDGFRIPLGTVLKFILVKSDGTFVMQEFTESLTLDSNMCASVGVGRYEILYNDEYVLSGAGNFYVESRALTDDVIDSYTEVYGLRFPEDFQEKLIAGDGIEIDEDNVISATGEIDFLNLYKDLKSWKNAEIVDGVAEFETVEATLLSRLTVGIEYEQDLHGYEYPWLGGVGKNKFIGDSGGVVNGVTIAKNSDGSYSFSGTATDTVVFTISASYSLPSGEYIVSGGTSDIRLGLNYGAGLRVEDSGSGVTINVTDNGIRWVQFVINVGVNVDGRVAYPMVRPSSYTNANFEPYENICPINGWSDVVVHVGDGQAVDKIYSIELGQTVYGGILDIISGTLIIYRGYLDLGDLTWYTRPALDGWVQSNQITNINPCTDTVRADIISDSFVVDTAANVWLKRIDGSISLNSNIIQLYLSRLANIHASDVANMLKGLKLVYDLENDINVQLSSQEILTLSGVNRISVNSGDVLSCVYSKIANKISAENVYMNSGESVEDAVNRLG